MSLESLLAFVANVGEDKIAGFSFNNSGRVMFTSSKSFSLDGNVTDDGYLKIGDSDTDGNIYYMYKPIATIESIIVVDDALARDKLNLRYIFG